MQGTCSTCSTSMEMKPSIKASSTPSSKPSLRCSRKTMSAWWSCVIRTSSTDRFVIMTFDRPGQEGLPVYWDECIQQMSHGEREMVVTVQKIFNWQPASQSSHFQLAFYSLKTGAPILERTLNATPSRTEMAFHYSLRISYLPDENEVILRLSHLPLRKEALLLAEIVINLDALASRKVQFFPFGSNDRVLKIVTGPSQTAQRCPLHGLPASSTSDNEAFLREKQQFLQRVITNSSSSSLRQDISRSKKSFSQRARDLLGEVQGMKGGGRQDGRNIEQEFNDYCQDPIASYYAQQDRMITSKHSPKIRQDQLQSVIRSKTQREESDSERRSNRSQKHKLELKNLQMVAVENEYYDQPLEDRKLQRRSDLLGLHHSHSRQKLTRREYY